MKNRIPSIAQKQLTALLAAIALNDASIAADIVLTPPAGGGVTVTNAAGNVTRLRVGEGGNVGVGVAPQSRFHVSGTSWFQGDSTPLPAAAGKGVAIGYVDGTSTGYIYAFDYGPFTPTNLVLNHVGGKVGIGTANPGDGRLHVDGGNITGVYGYSANRNGVEGRSGNGLGFGGYGVYGESAGGIGVYGRSTSGGYGVYGESMAGDAGYFRGSVIVTGNLTAANFLNPSDARLKQNVQSLRYGLPELMRLLPVSWNWIDQTQKQLPMGLIAQDVAGVLPELVLRDADPAKPLGLNYMGLLPIMIKAMQEQQDIIAALKSENMSLDARLKVLEQGRMQSRAKE